MKRMILTFIVCILGTLGMGAEPRNLAEKKIATADSVHQNYAPDKAVDGIVNNESRWISALEPGTRWLEIQLDETVTLAGAHLFSGWGESDPIENFVLQYQSSTGWIPIPGLAMQNNHSCQLKIQFTKPVKTDRVRLYCPNAPKGVRIKELMLWPPSEKGVPILGSGLRGDSDMKKVFPRDIHYALVNQTGYNLNWAKRFTAPLSTDNTTFIITTSENKEILYKGKIKNGIGDFTNFRPTDAKQEYVVRISGGTLADGVSDPFWIAPNLMQNVCLDPALRFMVDARSLIGTHPSAYGGSPWRDGTYYSFEAPSNVLLYLAHPDYFQNASIEINYAKERANILRDDYPYVKAPKAEKSLETARRYYKEIDPPVGDNVPDLIQTIHWTIGFYLLDPSTHDPSGDPLGDRIHAQTVEQFAFFLYGYPYFKQYFTNRFYQQARNFAFDHWEKVGLLEVNKTIGSYKGRHAPGHSIMPNLMMAEVARRESKTTAAKRFQQAAVNQAKWMVASLDMSDPIVTKGQRMSEHKMVCGLATLLEHYPDLAPAGVKGLLKKYAEIAIERSANMYDFRRYDDKDWTLPRFTPGAHGGAGWNEPGNTAAFPGLAAMIAPLLDDSAQKARLATLTASHFDTLFGRNPLMAHTAFHNESFPGTERGWPKKFPDNVCARLELVRGTISSVAASEHYPFNPEGPFRHPEGWVAFNSAFNVGLAYTIRANNRFEILDVETHKPLAKLPSTGKVILSLTVPGGIGKDKLRHVSAQVSTGPSHSEKIKLQLCEKRGDYRAVIRTASKMTVTYGHGIVATESVFF